MKRTYSHLKFNYSKIAIVLILIIWAFIAALPFYFTLITGLKEQFEVFNNGVLALPVKINLSNYISVIKSDIFLYFFNSVIVTGASLILILIISSLASYIFSRLKFKFNKLLLAVIVIAMTIPVHVTLIPIFLLTQKIGLYNTIWGLIGPYVAFNLPICIFILTNFMKEIPVDLEESAEIDGCGKIRTFFNIVLPLSKSGILTVAIYVTTVMWNEFIFALVLTQSKSNRTLPLSIWEFQGEYSSNTPMVMSVLTLTVFPIFIVFVVGQDKLVKGMMAGAVKG